MAKTDVHEFLGELDALKDTEIKVNIGTVEI